MRQRPFRQNESPDQGWPPIQVIRISFQICSVFANRQKIYTEKAISWITIREEGADLDIFKAPQVIIYTILTNIKSSLFSYRDVLCDSYDAKDKQQLSLHILNWLVFMFRIV